MSPLVALGLNGSQAKTFLALINRGTASIRETSKSSGLSRPETYRSMVSLEELGLIEKIISSPTKYKPLPLQEALTILIERKKKETEQLSKKAEEFYNQFKEISQMETEEFEDDFVLIPEGEPLLHKIEKMTENASTNLYAMLSQKKLAKWLLNYDTIEKALARGITIKILTEERLPELLLNSIVELKQKYQFELRYSRIPISVSFRLYDKKEVLLSTGSTADFSKSSAVWSRNVSLVELIRNYFNAAWYASMTPLQQEFKRDNRQFENLFANMKSGFAFNRIIYDKNGVAIDFLVLDANKSFLVMFGLSRDRLGKKATELIPRFDKNDAAVDALRQLAQGEQAKIEYYFDETNKWYSLLGYSPERGYFALIAEDITANKVAEQALRLSEERFEQMVEQSPIVIEVYNEQGFQIKVNNAYEKLWGISKNLTLGKYNILKSKQVANSDWHQYVERAYGGEVVKVPDYEYNVSLEFSIKEHPKTRWLTAILYPLKNESGVVTGIVVLHEDVTERKKAEKALMESEIKYGNIFQNISTGFAVCQMIFDKNQIPIDFRYIDVNKTFERIIGLKRRMVLGKTAKELFPLLGEQHPEMIKFYGQVATTGKAEKIELLFNPMNIWLEISASSTEKGYFVAAFNDITERKKAEDALRKSEYNYRRLFGNLRDAFVAVNMDGKITDANNAYEELLGYSLDELKHRTYVDLTPVKWHDMENRLVSEQIIPFGQSILYEKEYRRKDGKVIPVELLTYLLKDENGVSTGMATVVRDISERKKIEENIKSSEKSLEEAQVLAHLGNWEWDIKKSQPKWSAEMYKIYGVDEATFKITPENCNKLAFIEDRAYVQEMQERVLINGIPASFDHRIVLSTGEIRWVHVETKLNLETSTESQILSGTVQDITERKNQENSLKESEQKFKSVCTESQNIIFIRQGKKMVYANEKCLRTGYSIDEIESSNFDFSTLAGDDKSRNALKLSYEACQQGIDYPPFRFTLRTKQGKTLELLFTLKLITYGNDPAVLGIATDITDLTNKERALEKCEKRFRQISDNSHEWIWEVDTQGTYTYSSGVVEKILGYTAEEIVGKKHFYDFFDPEDCERLKLLASCFSQEKQPFRSFVNKNIDKNGKTVWLSISGVPIINDLGELVGYRGSGQNITPFILAEDLLKASEEKYRGLFEASFDAIMLTKPDGTILAANSHACNLLGMSEEEIKKAGRNGIVVQDEKLRVALKEREENSHAIAEIAFRRKDGTTFLAQVSSAFFKDSKGNIFTSVIIRPTR